MLKLTLTALIPLVLHGASYYTVRLDDPKAIYLTRENFPAKGDGVADDTRAIQKAIDAVQEASGEGVFLVPEGRYRLSRTLYVWPRIRLIGYGAKTAGVRARYNAPQATRIRTTRYLVFFAGGRRQRRPSARMPNPGTFYSAMSNVDLEIQGGNAGAVGVRATYAQHCFTSHVEFRIGCGLAGVHEGGNVAEDVRFLGGEYGIWTGTPSPGWQYHARGCLVRRTAARRDPRARGGAHADPSALPQRSDGDRDRSRIARRALGEGRPFDDVSGPPS